METLAGNDLVPTNRLPTHGAEDVKSIASVNEKMREAANEVIRISREKYFELRSSVHGNLAVVNCQV